MVNSKGRVLVVAANMSVVSVSVHDFASTMGTVVGTVWTITASVCSFTD